MSQHPDHCGARRFLIVRPSALGDVCRTVPVLVSVRRAYPDARIDWIVREDFLDAVRAHPDLDEAIPFPRSRFARWWRAPEALIEMIRWCGLLRGRRYDVVFDLQGLGRSGMIAAMTGSPRRVGFRNAREFGWLGYNVRHRPPVTGHIVDQMLELLEREGIEAVRDMRLYTPQQFVEWWRGERNANRSLEEPYVVLAPTSRWRSKRWPIDHWSRLIRQLRQRGFDRFIIVGAPGERAQVAPLLRTQSDGIIDLVGKTTVGQMMAVIESSDLVIANDSAPLHMAVGFDRPLVALFGPTDPEFVGPYGRRESVLQATAAGPRGRSGFRDAAMRDGAMMGSISVEQVLERLPRAQAALDP